MFQLYYTDEAQEQYDALKKDKGLKKRYNSVKNALSHLKRNPRHPSLQTHEFTGLTKLVGKKVFEAYAEQNTPAAYRIFWFYGPNKKEITVISITSHP